MYCKSPKLLNTITLFILWISINVLASCKSASTSTAISSTKEVQNNPKIVFLNYSIKQQQNGQRHISFVSSKKVDGKLKKQNNNEQVLEKDLICYQLDETSAIISSSIIKDPLRKHIEYVTESKELATALINLDSTLFSVRLQLHPSTKHITINEGNSPNPSVVLNRSML